MSSMGIDHKSSWKSKDKKKDMQMVVIGVL